MYIERLLRKLCPTQSDRLLLPKTVNFGLDPAKFSKIMNICRFIFATQWVHRTIITQTLSFDELNLVYHARVCRRTKKFWKNIFAIFAFDNQMVSKPNIWNWDKVYGLLWKVQHKMLLSNRFVVIASPGRPIKNRNFFTSRFWQGSQVNYTALA